MIGYRQFVEQSKEELRAAADAAFKKHGSSFAKGGAHQKPTYGHSKIKVSAGKPETGDHDHSGGVAMHRSGGKIRRDHTKNIPVEFYGKKGYGNEGHTGRPGDKPGRSSPTPTPPANAPRADLHRYRSRAMGEENINELSKGLLRRYINTAASKVGHHSYAAGSHAAKYSSAKYPGEQDKQRSLHNAHWDKRMRRQKGITRAVDRLTKEGLNELLGKGRLDDLRTHYHTRAVRKRAWAQNDPGRKHYANDNVDTQTDQKKLDRATALKRWRDSSHDRQFQRARAMKYAHEEKDFKEQYLDEISKRLAYNYAYAANAAHGLQSRFADDADRRAHGADMKQSISGKDHNAEKLRAHATRINRKAYNRKSGIDRALKILARD